MSLFPYYTLLTALSLTCCTTSEPNSNTNHKNSNQQDLARSIHRQSDQKTLYQIRNASSKNFQEDYKNCIAWIQEEKATITTTNASKEAQQLRKAEFFKVALMDSLIPYWYGTTWEFNGHTDKPQHGEIACGYFVSTPLKQMGFPINRYRVAQKAAADIIEDLCGTASTKWFNFKEDLIKHINSQENNCVYVLGLDNHVGFILREKGKNYFIHSNYTGNGIVEKEFLGSSEAINYSNRFALGKLNHNPVFIKKWLSP